MTEKALWLLDTSGAVLQVLVIPLTVPARAKPTLNNKVLLKAVSKLGKTGKGFHCEKYDTDKIVSHDALKTATVLEVSYGRILYTLTC